MAWEKFYSWLAQNPNYTHFVEVGVFEGASISHLARELKKTGRRFTINGIDLWERSHSPSYDRQVPASARTLCEQRLAEVGVGSEVTLYQEDSVLSAAKFRKQAIDVVYLDANHAYENVKDDIEAWLPKVRIGGLISGHDYGEDCGVKQAVDERFKDQVVTWGTVWYVHV